MKVLGFSKLVLIMFVMVVAIFASLFVFGAVDKATLTDSVTKIGLVGLIAIVCSAIVSFISSK